MRINVIFFAAAALLGQPFQSLAQSTVFTYQGRLDHAGEEANGIYDFRFTLYNVPSDGTAISGAITNEATAVSNGVFTVLLNFGSAVFDGGDRWLEIAVRTNGGGAFTSLSPRQPITATPYAITAARLSGVVPNSGIGGAYSNAVIFNNAANDFTGSFIGNGGALSNVNAMTLEGLAANRFWKLAGNADTTPGADFLGTTDSRPLELKVANDRVFRFEPALEVPNLIGGSRSNSVAAGIRGATIAGGGLPLYPHTISADYGAIGGGTFHVVSGPWGTIAGGRDNREHSESATIGGGFRNTIQSNSFYATIAGGFANTISNIANGSIISGGSDNQIGSASAYSTISGGTANNVLTNSDWSVIGGGGVNVISNDVFAATISGGSYNLIQAGAYGVIGGGNHNTIYSNSLGAVLAGGFINAIHTNSAYATIGGGKFNNAYGEESTVSGGAFNNALAFSAAIGGGGGHRVESSWSVITGGRDNVISSNTSYSSIGGGFGNRAVEPGFGATVGGGARNSAEAAYATVGGGNFNTNAGLYATIGGGWMNGVSGIYATVPGGQQNSASGNYSLAAGRSAKATFPGAFVWADSAGSDFVSTAPNQFSVRASGGVRLVTSGAGATVDGNPILAGTVSSSQIADGASLTEILDDDGPGSGLNADLLDGLNSTAFATASHNHFGESWIGAANTGLQVTTTNSAFAFVTGILGRQGTGIGFDFGTPTGVWGDAQTGFGVVGTTIGEHSYGVRGAHVHSNGLGSGVFGSTSSTAGRGVTGTAGATSGPGIGVFGYVHSPLGIGVYGKHETTAGTAAGVQGDTDSTAASAVGLLGRVTSTAPGGNSAAVRGINNGTGGNGIGVWGSQAGDGWGVLGTANSGIGVRGTSTSGVGLVGLSNSGNPIEAFSATDREFYVSNTGSVFADGPYSGAGADFAELLPAKGGLEAGDVLVVDEDGEMTRSTEAHQENVVGVYSTKPGFLGGADENGDNTGKVPLAVVGVVPVKVTGENGPIKPGNLLVTSSTPGHAMKAGSDRQVGTIIGKALAPFNGSSGVIRILVVLQ
jgi:hypothetical protein